VLGYTLYYFCTVADQTDFEEIVSDIQETLVYDNTTVMSVNGINKMNLQIADDEWDQIYNYVDEVQVK
jgi:hypothetical protein